LELYTAPSSQYNEFAPGFYHATLEGITKDYGPIHINILRINLERSKCRMKCLDARGTTTDLSNLAQEAGAMAAISGGFFLYSEPDIEAPSKRTDPVGLLVSDGNVCLPPVFRRAAIFQRRRRRNDEEERLIGMDKIGMDGVTCVLKVDEDCVPQTFELTIDQIHVKCIHRGDAEELNVAENSVGLAIVGSEVVAVSSTKLLVPLAGCIITFLKSMVPDWIFDKHITVQYKLPSSLRDVANAMAGGPVFFFSENDDDINNYSMNMEMEDFRGSAPPITFSQDETFDRNLLPRMGVGTTKGGKELCCVAVDGRNLKKALGLTLQGTSDLLKSLGCTRAMNLDGGSSKRMVIFDQQTGKYKVVCLSTTEIKAKAGNETDPSPSRPVHSAILFLPHQAKVT
jgi:hypothetical protein